MGKLAAVRDAIVFRLRLCLARVYASRVRGTPGALAPKYLVWKDTVLVRTGETLDILLDVTDPGRWVAHCHIAEHRESGMMFSFNVEP